MIPLCIPYTGGNEEKYLKECLDNNWISAYGQHIGLFEEKFSEFIGCKHALAVSNGTSSLHLALKVLNIGPGDEVIVPSLTFAASVNPIIYQGASPVFCDIAPDNYTIDPNEIEKLITERTKAIIPVHLYGNPADMRKIMEIADFNNISVIEDATESLGAECRVSEKRWMKTGTIGQIGCFSFNGNKTITTGNGGMIVTNNLSLYEKAKHLSNQAKSVCGNQGFYHDDVGYNYRMPNILAAIGLAQLEQLNEFLHIKSKNAKYYNSKLENIYGIKIHEQNINSVNSYWLYSPLIQENFKKNRDSLINDFKKQGIESRPFFSPLHLMPPYKGFKCGEMKISMEISKQGINLPSSITLTYNEIDKIVGVIKKYS